MQTFVIGVHQPTDGKIKDISRYNKDIPKKKQKNIWTTKAKETKTQKSCKQIKSVNIKMS